MMNKEETLNVISFCIKLLLAIGALRIIYDAKYVVLQLFAIFILYLITVAVTRLLRFIFRGGK